MGGDIAQEKDGASAGFLVTDWAVGKSGILLRACAPRHTSTALRWHTLQSQQSLNLLGFLVADWSCVYQRLPSQLLSILVSIPSWLIDALETWSISLNLDIRSYLVFSPIDVSITESYYKLFLE
jgi:hypothetical protein